MARQEDKNGGSQKADVVVTFTSVKPKLLVEASKASDAVQFYKTAFGAVETDRITQPKRKADQELPHVISAQLQLAGSSIIVADLADDSPKMKTDATKITLCLETEDVEGAISKAVAAGAVAEGEITEGGGACVGSERVGKVKDPYGFVWFICCPAKKSCADGEA